MLKRYPYKRTLYCESESEIEKTAISTWRPQTELH